MPEKTKIADMKITTIRKNDKKLNLLIQEILESLLGGNRFLISGFGTFSTCTRKATSDRPACTMAMFRASTELRDYAVGGSPPKLSGTHAEIIKKIIAGMKNENGINIPGLGRMAVVAVPGKKPKLIFHGSNEFNDKLSPQ